jgi:hypothetical protein
VNKDVVTFDSHGIFQVQETGLLDAVSGGLFDANVQAQTFCANGTCGSDFNGQCGPVNTGCIKVTEVNTTCGANQPCSLANGACGSGVIGVQGNVGVQGP